MRYAILNLSQSWAFRLSRCVAVTALLLGGAIGGPGLLAEAVDRFAEVKVSGEKVAGNVHILMGAGGNIAASIGPDGTLIVDDQYAPLAGRIQQRLVALGGDKPELIINTHFHGDHSGGNAHFGEHGTIIAHENVRVRLMAGDAQRSALPAVTYDDRVRVHYNDEAIDIVHMPAGHTDGDSVVWFRGANVIHMGDHLFSGSYPYIDVDSGGSVVGVMNNLEAVLGLVTADTKVIPGHGPLGGVEAIRQALVLVKNSALLVLRESESGKSDTDIVALLDQEFPNAGKGFISSARWLEIVRKSRAAHGG